MVEELKEKAEKSDYVFLATDPDREGEAISWHLAYLLDLNTEDDNRVTFNEITKTGVTNGMEHPRSIDMDLVNAQQARRILDRLVGYKLSPFLSQKIRRGLSGGRVQSVAVRLVVDREEEIRKFVPKEYWTIDAKMIPKGSRKAFPATFYGDENGKIEIENKEQADQILAELEGAEYKISKLKRARAAIPCAAVYHLHPAAGGLAPPGVPGAPDDEAAQELYEGVEIEGMARSVSLLT